MNEVRRLFQTAQQPPRWPMYVRQAKQFMRSVDSTFDERKFGFASIVDLLRACSREGLFKIERDRQGVMRLFQGNVMQAPVEGVEAEPTVPGAPRPWRPGDDIPDIHESDRDEPVAAAPLAGADVVEGDVVREIETPEVLDAQPAADAEGEEAPAPKKRSRTARVKSGEPKAAKAPRAKKTAKAARTAKTSRTRKTAEQ